MSRSKWSLSAVALLLVALTAACGSGSTGSSGSTGGNAGGVVEVPSVASKPDTIPVPIPVVTCDSGLTLVVKSDVDQASRTVTLTATTMEGPASCMLSGMHLWFATYDSASYRYVYLSPHWATLTKEQKWSATVPFIKGIGQITYFTGGSECAQSFIDGKGNAASFKGCTRGGVIDDGLS